MTVDPVRSDPPRRRPAGGLRRGGATVGLAVIVGVVLACSGTRDNPDRGEGRDPITSQTTTRDGGVRGGSGDGEPSTTDAVGGSDVPTGPIDASGQDEGGDPSGSTIMGAEPGQDVDDLQPPGGTFGVPDPGGDSSSDPPRRTGGG